MQATEMLMMISMFTMYVVLGWLLIRWRVQVRRMAHDERMRALELRQPIPPDSVKGRMNPYLFPLLFGGAGVGLCGVGVMLDQAEPALGFGLVLLFVGLGWFAAAKMNGENRQRQDEMAQKQQDTYLRALESLGSTDVIREKESVVPE